MADRDRLAVLDAARIGELTYTPSAHHWAISGRMVARFTLNLDPDEPERCRSEGLLHTVWEDWDHYLGVLTNAGRARLGARPEKEKTP